MTFELLIFFGLFLLICIILVRNSHMQPILSPLLEATGIPIDMAKTAIVLIINFLFTFFYRFLVNPKVRSYYGLIIGTIQLIFLLQEDSFYVFTVLFVTIAITKMAKNIPFKASMICSALFLLVVHLHRFIFDYSSWKVDCSVYVMILVTKLTYYGLALQENRTEHSILDAFSFCLFFPSLIAGPTFSFAKYMDFLYLRKQYQNIKYSSKSIVSPLLLGILVSAMTMYGVANIPTTWPLTNQFYLSSSIFGKLMIMNCIGIFYRAKFYTAWYLTQVSINISGVSYNPKENTFDSAIGGSIMFQIQINPKNKTQYWSTSVQIWLKQIIYEPIFKSTKSQTIATFSTFAFSAFWHGIYLTYYIGFFQWALIIHLTKWIYKMSILLPQKLKQSYFTKILAYLVSSTVLNYTGMVIVVLQWNSAVELYSQLNYSITILIIAVSLISFVVKPPRAKGQKKQVQSKAL